MTDCSAVNIPTYPSSGACQQTDADGAKHIYFDSKSPTTLHQEHLDRYEAKFNELMASSTSNNYDKHTKINCLLNGLLQDIKTNYQSFNVDLGQLQAQLNSERKHVEQQENVLRTNEDSELVTKYRNENSEKRNKQMNTQFTIFVTMIVIFLIVEGIVFFV